MREPNPPETIARGSRCLDDAASTASTGRSRGQTIGVVLLGVGTLALLVPVVFAITSLVDLIMPSAQAPKAAPANHSRLVAGPGKTKASPRRKVPLRRPPPIRAWPQGTQSAEFTLIATNIPPGAPYNASTILLEGKSNRYVLLSKGDKVGAFEVVQIAMDWVQLRQGSAKSWVTYGKNDERRKRGRARGRGPSDAQRALPSKVRRLPPLKGPRVSYKWIVGRLNLHGELEEHLNPKVTAKGVQVGKVTMGFRRMGLKVGDVIQRAGNRKVRNLDDIRNGLQPAASPGARSTLTVLRNGRPMELHFGVQ
jgi:hypothetical protein